MHISAEILKLTRAYIAHGVKDNRRQQVKRMITACAWIVQRHNVGSIHEIGQKHIVDFYRHHRQFGESTIKGYFYAFRSLYRILGRAGDPPRPWLSGSN